MAAETRVGAIRFGPFEFESASGRLKKNGVRVKLATQPSQILAALLNQPRELITRETLRTALWGDDPSADAEHSINVAVAKLREALGDSADDPVFIATVPRKGYRFIGAVTAVEPAAPEGRQGIVRRTPTAVAAFLILLAIVGFLGYRKIAAAVDLRTGKIRLAVLPFENFGNPEQDYFCDGLTEETIARLSRIRPERLAVIARTSVMRYKQGKKPIREIGHDLAVDYVLEGSVRRDGTRVRVTAQLIHVPDESHVWAESYDRDIASPISLQSDVAQRVEAGIALKLTPGAALQSSQPVDPRARDEYLRGRYQWNKRNREAFLKAIAHFNQAIAFDPMYARAYSGLADAYLLLANSEPDSSEAIAKSRAGARRALEIDPTLAEPHASLGLIAMNHDWDWAGSEREYRRAIEINPNYSTAHHWYAELLNSLGRVDEAVYEIARARELDPLSLGIATDTGKILYYGRRYSEAIQWLQKVLDEDRQFGEAHMYLVEAYASAGKWQEALRDLDTYDDPGRSNAFLDRKAWLLARSGRREEARQLMNELERRASMNGDLTYGGLGYIALGDREKALASYENAVDKHTHTVTSLKVHPLLDPLRSEPRFVAMLRRVGLQ